VCRNFRRVTEEKDKGPPSEYEEFRTSDDVDTEVFKFSYVVPCSVVIVHDVSMEPTVTIFSAGDYCVLYRLHRSEIS
jgi:hypothetical protein